MSCFGEKGGPRAKCIDQFEIRSLIQLRITRLTNDTQRSQTASEGLRYHVRVGIVFGRKR